MSLLRDVSEDDVYLIRERGVAQAGQPQQFHMRFVLMDQLSAEDWKGVEGLTGRISARYLRWSYRHRFTALLLIMSEGCVVGVLWVIPSAAIRRRYPFVREGCGAIIACVTHPSFRGLGLYSAGIRAIAASGHSHEYFIWAHKDNVASLKGMLKAGGLKVGEFTRVRWFRGLITWISFRSQQAL